MSCPEVISSISDALLAVAAIATAGVAIYGVKSWARELRGRATFEVARSLARSTYKLRQAIRIARSPLIRFQEFPDNYDHMSNKGSHGEIANAYAHVFTKRMAPVWDAYDEFDVQTLEAEALWGGEIREKTDELRALVRKLSAAAEAYIYNEASGKQSFEADREFGKQIRSELFASPTQRDNELTNAIEASIKAIESALRPHLRQG